ncbi:MAG TPA: hypothetical protein VHQ22_03245 [Terriglobales bacterium]|nr:hypothetical protein [Terriglobales bacterium]
MFGPHDNPPSLRQGDIVADLFFPLPRQGRVQYIASRTAGTDIELQLEPFVERPPNARKLYLTAVTQGLVSHGVVLSQCCDLDRNHPKPSFVVARLVPFDLGRVRNAQSLRDNVDPYGEIPPHLQYFHLGQIEGLAQGDYVADFGFTVTVSWADYDFALQRKSLQLDQLHRNLFRVKAGAHLGRPTPEDQRDGYANPYLGINPALPAVPEDGPQAEGDPAAQDPAR